MISFLLYILIRKHGKGAVAKAVAKIRQLANRYLPLYFMAVSTMLLLLMPLCTKSQNLELKYKICQGGDEIGWLSIYKNMDGNKLTITLTSEIKTRVIFTIAVSTKESSSFRNGQLLHSSVFRKTNGHTKINKQTALNGEVYEVVKNGQSAKLPFSYIGKNLLSLYFQEPVGISKVYSDNHERFLNIAKTDEGAYKVKFPDGNSNIFYYSAGACTKIKIFHTLYNATVTRTP